jgi:hypothetical protein
MRMNLGTGRYDRTPPPRLPLPCHRCPAPTVGRVPGTDTPVCEDCWLRELAEHAGTVPAAMER